MICKICGEEFNFRYGIYQGYDRDEDVCPECQRTEFEASLMDRDDHLYPYN